MENSPTDFDFRALVSAIRNVDEHLAAQAGKAVNACLTLRNWAIGRHIQEYEQHGADRAEYGQQLMERLAERLRQQGMPRVEPRELRRYRQLYMTYPQIRESLTPEFRKLLPDSDLCAMPEIRETVSPELALNGTAIINRLSFSHLVELIAIDDMSKRIFYEVECMRGNWSVRELRRQVASLYYERSGLSTDKDTLSERAHAAAQQAEPRLAIRDPYVFEFLGIKPKEAMHESDLEDALLDKLQDFLLELGHGFCFEARQKRILIGDTHGFVDLVFYHRILKCHVLVELKVEAFTHENLGQLNTYVSWYRKNIMVEGDSPPVGILLCTHKDHALVEYALAGIDNKLFVSKYQLELPTKEAMLRFLEEKMREVSNDNP